MNDIVLFSNQRFGNVRCVSVNGEPWFVAKDVCDILELTNSRKATSRLDEDEKADVTLSDGRQNRSMTIINESGLYNLIMSSKKPEAKEFRRWITHEVIPSIRQNGGYIAGQENMSDEEILAKGLEVAQRIIAQKDNLIAQKNNTINDLSKTIIYLDEDNKRLESEVAIHKEKSEYVDDILKQEGLITMTDLMHDYGLSAERGNRIFYILGIIKNKKDWQISTKYSILGIGSRETYEKETKYGKKHFINLKYNQRGRFFVYVVFKAIGIKPCIERSEADSERAKEIVNEFDRIWNESNNGNSSLLFRNLKESIKESFKEGIKNFVRDLKDGKLEEFIGDKFDVDDVKEDMYVDLWKDVEGNEEERMKKYRSWSIK